MITIWISVKKPNIDSLGNIDDALSSLIKLAAKKPHWDLFFEIARIYREKEEDKNALLFMCRSALAPDVPKGKVTLLYEMALLLNEIGEPHFAYYTCKIC